MENGIKQDELDLIKQGVSILVRQNKENELALTALVGLICGMECGEQCNKSELSEKVIIEGEE